MVAGQLVLCDNTAACSGIIPTVPMQHIAVIQSHNHTINI